MGLIDINKNSLPEQVQENKEKIADLESTRATKEYVDDQDAATLGLAKTYADGKDATTLQSAKDYADLAAAGALGDAKTYADTGLALKQNVLTDSTVPDGTIDKSIGFDSNGNLVKGAAGGSGGLTLKWSGSITLSSGSENMPITLETDKKYMFMFEIIQSCVVASTFVKNSTQVRFSAMGTDGTPNIILYAFSISNSNAIKIGSELSIGTTGTITQTSNGCKLRFIYEVN